MTNQGPWSLGIEDGGGGTGKREVSGEELMISRVRDLRDIHVLIRRRNVARETPCDGHLPPGAGRGLVTATTSRAVDVTVIDILIRGCAYRGSSSPHEGRGDVRRNLPPSSIVIPVILVGGAAGIVTWSH
jgi:hypothetical protein